MSTAPAVSFSDVSLHGELDLDSNEDLDGLEFGVVGSDATGVVQRCNSFERKAAGLSSRRVLGQALFTVLAP